MAGPQRTSTHAVEYEKELEQRPFASHLFQVLRRLENLDPSRPRIGKAKTPRHEPWRFRQDSLRASLVLESVCVFPIHRKSLRYP